MKGIELFNLAIGIKPEFLHTFKLEVIEKHYKDRKDYIITKRQFQLLYFLGRYRVLDITAYAKASYSEIDKQISDEELERHIAKIKNRLKVFKVIGLIKESKYFGMTKKLNYVILTNKGVRILKQMFKRREGIENKIKDYVLIYRQFYKLFYTLYINQKHKIYAHFYTLEEKKRVLPKLYKQIEVVEYYKKNGEFIDKESVFIIDNVQMKGGERRLEKDIIAFYSMDSGIKKSIWTGTKSDYEYYDKKYKRSGYDIKYIFNPYFQSNK